MAVHRNISKETIQKNFWYFKFVLMYCGVVAKGGFLKHFFAKQGPFLGTFSRFWEDSFITKVHF